jgi:hypothetical protein
MRDWRVYLALESLIAHDKKSNDTIPEIDEAPSRVPEYFKGAWCHRMSYQSNICRVLVITKFPRFEMRPH